MLYKWVGGNQKVTLYDFGSLEKGILVLSFWRSDQDPLKFQNQFVSTQKKRFYLSFI